MSQPLATTKKKSKVQFVEKTATKVACHSGVEPTLNDMSFELSKLNREMYELKGSLVNLKTYTGKIDDSINNLTSKVLTLQNKVDSAMLVSKNTDSNTKHMKNVIDLLALLAATTSLVTTLWFTGVF